ncbi:MAG: bifunctional hydroxymethylpyrimidine kinase/phosphomethylpyrimidine kinase [Anaerolineae bacterium]|nr:bifunctional hydroxymethylpyrimidine kinase/phosphomethylpyrimidine kinase [Anaerolineae bacterium]
MIQPPAVLTIGGSDSGGAAGIQADLKSFTAWRVYGMSVLTAVTAQNSVRVAGVHYLPPDFVAAQIDAVLEDYGAAAVKTGFTGRTELVEIIAGRLHAWHTGEPARVGPLVVDPVLVNHRSEPMFAPEVGDAYCDLLLPQATLVLPNRAEAALLTGEPVTTLASAETAARALAAMGARNVLVKGIPAGQEIADLFFDGQHVQIWRAPRLDTANRHGSGDTLSAAIAAALALGLPLDVAIAEARAYTQAALRGGSAWRLGAGHGPLAHWASTAEDEPADRPGQSHEM